MGSLTLSSEVLRHIGRIRANPALAVAPEEIDALEKRARQDLEGAQVALASPAAEYTMLSRVTLLAANDASEQDTIDTFGRPIEIVGLFPEIQPIETGTVPPMSAFDVQIGRTKGERRIITAMNQTASSPAGTAPDFCSLSAVSAVVANRTLLYRIPEPQALLGFQYRWSISSAARTALAYADVQISMNIFYRLLASDERY